MKSTKAEINNRISEVYILLTKAHTYTEIAKYCKDKYNVSSSNTVAKYIKRATEIMVKDNQKTIEELRAEANNRYNAWIRKAESKEDYKTATYIQSRKDKINGLEVQEIKLTTNYDNETKDLLFQILKKDNDKE